MTRKETSRYLSQPIFDFNNGILPEQKSEKKEKTGLSHRSFGAPGNEEPYLSLP